MNLLELFKPNYLILLSGIVLINFFILSFRNKIANQLKINDIPNNRKIHKKPTPLIGEFVSL